MGPPRPGVRRIEALTGKGRDISFNTDGRMARLANDFESPADRVRDARQQLLDERKALRTKWRSLRRELALSGGADGAAAEPISMVESLPCSGFARGHGPDLPALVDAHKAKMGSGVCLADCRYGR